MAENYCGKSCTECTKKELLTCPGCFAGPGRQNSGTCEIAKCCRDKGHESCDTCGYNTTCRSLKRRENMPDIRLRELEIERKKKERLAKDAPVLGKWLWLLFWLVVPSAVVALLTTDTVAGQYPNLYFIGQILSAVLSAAYGFILLQLTQQDFQYKTAGILCLITAAANAVISVISGVGEIPDWTLVISLPTAVISLVGEYNEFMAHSGVLRNINIELSEKWEQLWKWNIKCYAALIASIVAMLVLPLIGLLLLIAGGIGVIVVSVMKLVYVYRTAKLFREYPGA